MKTIFKKNRDYVFVIATQIVAVFISYGVHLLYTNNLTLTQYGSITLGLGYLSMMTMFSKFGMDTLYLKNTHDRNRIKSRLRLTVFYNSLIILSLVILTSIFKPNLYQTLPIICALPFYSIMTQITSEWRAESKFIKALAIPMIWSFLGCVLIFIFKNIFVFRIGLFAYSCAALLILLFVVSIKEFRVKEYSLNKYFTNNRTGFPYILADGAQMLNGRIDLIVLGSVGLLSEVAIYELSFRLTMAFALVVNALSFVLGPRLAREISDGTSFKANRTSGDISNLILVIGLLFLLVIWLFGDVLLGFFGSEYRKAINVLTILAVSQVVSSASGPLGLRLTLGKERDWMIRYAGISILLNLVFSFGFYKNYGLLGIAYVTLFSNVFKFLAFKFKMRYVC